MPLHFVYAARVPSRPNIALTIVQRNVGDLTVLEFKGRVVLAVYARIRDLITQLLQQGRTRLIFDYSDIAYVDSSGNGFLVLAYTAARNSGGLVVLAEPTKRYLDLLQISKVATVVEIFETTSKALAFFGVKEVAADQSEPVVHVFEYE